MNEQEALAKMVAPGTHRPGKYREGVIQVWVTRACDKACFNCTQGSNLAGKPEFMSPQHFDQACQSLKGYWGVVGVFGGNPALHSQFPLLCEILSSHFPFEQRGLWCNHPKGHGRIMRQTFNPAVSNLNVHLDQEAYDEFKRDWPESRPFGLREDSRHAPVHLAMKDVLHKDCPECRGGGKAWTEGGPRLKPGYYDPCNTCQGLGYVYDEEKAWELISGCDINKHWSAMIGVFRRQLRAWFCEVAGAQAMLHQHEEDYPDTGVPIGGPIPQLAAEKTKEVCGHPLEVGMVFSGHFPANESPVQHWWKLPMTAFADQVRKHCHECGVPLRGHGELAQVEQAISKCPRCEGSGKYSSLGEPARDCAVCRGYGWIGSRGYGSPEPKEQTSNTHASIYRPKRPGRKVEIVTELIQLGSRVPRVIDYLKNAR